MMKTFGVIVGALALMLFAAVVFSLIGGTILYFAWPVVMVTVFKLPALTYWQAVALSYVAHILIKPINVEKGK